MPRRAVPRDYKYTDGALIEGFSTSGDWTLSPVNPAQMEIVAGGGMRLTSTSSANNQQAIKTISKLFTASDGFLTFYVTPTSNVANIVLGFSSTASFATIYMNYTLSSTAWWPNKRNLVRLKLSDFTATGGDSFSNTMIRMRVRVVSNDANPADALFEDLRTNMRTRAKIMLQTDNAGNASTVNILYPILAAANYKATLFVQSNLIDTSGLTTVNLTTLYNAGWDLGNHTTDHIDLTSISTSDAVANLNACKSFLDGKGFTRASAHVAYPVGAVNLALRDAVAAAGYTTARKTTDKLQYTPCADVFRLDAYTIKNADSLALMKSYIEDAITYGATATIMTEGLANSTPAAQEVLTATYQSLIDYIKLKDKQGLLDVVTITQWFNGLTNPRGRA